MPYASSSAGMFLAAGEIECGTFFFKVSISDQRIQANTGIL